MNNGWLKLICHGIIAGGGSVIIATMSEGGTVMNGVTTMKIKREDGNYETNKG